MKRFLALLLLFGAMAGRSDQRITAVVTITNAPTTNGMSITVNGFARTWTNVDSIFYITTNNTIGGCASNLFASYAKYHDSGSTSLQFEHNGTNAMTIRGAINGALTVSVSAGWATVALTTNPVTAQIPVAYPIASEQSGITKTNLLNYHIDAINQSTNRIIPGASTVNLVDTSTGQTVGGTKLFSGTLTMNGAVNVAGNFNGTGSVNSFGTLSVTTLKPTVITNANTIYNSKLISPTISNALATILSATNWNATPAITAYGSGSGNVVTVMNHDGVTRVFTVDDSGSVTAAGWAALNGITNHAGAYFYDSFNVDIGCQANLNGNAAIAGLAGTRNGTLLTIDTNGVFDSSEFQNVDAFAWSSTNNTGLANGNNADVAIGDARIVRLSGPTGSFAIVGFDGGFAGREMVAKNPTGQSWTIANQSGLDSIAANRIITGTGADVVVTNNIGCAHFTYNGNSSRWELDYHSN